MAGGDVEASDASKVDNLKIESLRQTFFEKFADNIDKGVYDERDIERFKTDERFAQRFVQARTKMEDSVSLVHGSLKWRLEIGINDLTESSFFDELWTEGGMYYHNTDKDGQKVLICAVRKHRKDPEILPVVRKFFAYWLERSYQECPNERIVLLFDMTDTGLGNMDMDFTRYCMNCFKCYYPGLLSYMLILEMPWIFNAAWKVIKTWLGAEAAKRVKFVSKSDIQEYINTDQLMEHMGGTDQWQYSASEVQNKPLSEHRSGSVSKKRVTFAESEPFVFQSVDSTDPSPTDERDKEKFEFIPRQTSKMDMEENCYNGRLLRISPAETLVFDVDDHVSDHHETIYLANPHGHPVAFKVKTTSPEKFRVRPSMGIVKPWKIEEIHVRLEPGSSTNLSGDKFLIMAKEGDSGMVSSPLIWKTASKDGVMEHRLRCVWGKKKSVSDMEMKPRIPPAPTSSVENQITHLGHRLDELSSDNQEIHSMARKIIILQFATLFMVSLLCVVFFVYGGSCSGSGGGGGGGGSSLHDEEIINSPYSTPDCHSSTW